MQLENQIAAELRARLSSPGAVLVDSDVLLFGVSSCLAFHRSLSAETASACSHDFANDETMLYLSENMWSSLSKKYDCGRARGAQPTLRLSRCIGLSLLLLSDLLYLAGANEHLLQVSQKLLGSFQGLQEEEEEEERPSAPPALRQFVWAAVRRMTTVVK